MEGGEERQGQGLRDLPGSEGNRLPQPAKTQEERLRRDVDGIFLERVDLVGEQDLLRILALLSLLSIGAVPSIRSATSSMRSGPAFRES